MTNEEARTRIGMHSTTKCRCIFELAENHPAGSGKCPYTAENVTAFAAARYVAGGAMLHTDSDFAGFVRRDNDKIEILSYAGYTITTDHDLPTLLDKVQDMATAGEVVTVRVLGRKYDTQWKRINPESEHTHYWERVA